MEALASRLARALARRPWLTVFMSVLVAYLLTAHYAVGQNSDSVGAVWPAYAFTHTGTFRLDEVSRLLPDIPGFYVSNGHLVAARSMGVLLTALPAQLLLGWTGLSPVALGAITAAVVTAAGMATLYLALLSLVRRRVALAGVGLLAFGTATWTIAAAELWTHGPDVLWLSLVLLGMSRQQYWLAGTAFVPAVWTRPHLVLVAAPLGIWAAWHHRSPRALVAFGAPGLLAVAALSWWNGWYYGQAGVSGSYAGHVERAIQGGQGVVPSLWTNLLGTTFSPWCGVLLFTPVVAVAVLALPGRTRSAPGWTKAAAVGAVLYVIGQFRVSNFDGGGAQYGNRYLIEPMLLTLPLVLPAVADWARQARWRSAVTCQLAALSVAIYAAGAFLAPFWQGISGNWVAWYPYVVLRTAGPTGAVVTVVAVAVLAVVSVIVWRPGAVVSTGDVPTQRASDGLSISKRASRPLTNTGLSSVDKLAASSTASLTATASGTSSRQSSS